MIDLNTDAEWRGCDRISEKDLTEAATAIGAMPLRRDQLPSFDMEYGKEPAMEEMLNIGKRIKYCQVLSAYTDEEARYLLKRQKELAIALCRRYDIPTLDRACGAMEKAISGNVQYFAEGSDEDLKNALKFAKYILSDVKGVHFSGLSALLYSKTEYFIMFVVDGIEAEFQICVPSWNEYNITNREFGTGGDGETTNCDLRLVIEAFKHPHHLYGICRNFDVDKFSKEVCARLNDEAFRNQWNHIFCKDGTVFPKEKDAIESGRKAVINEHTAKRIAFLEEFCKTAFPGLKA